MIHTGQEFGKEKRSLNNPQLFLLVLFFCDDNQRKAFGNARLAGRP